MKNQLYFITIILSSFICKGQHSDRVKEGIDWVNSPAYTANKIQFESDEIKFDCINCKYLEIKSQSGISGIFVIGEGFMNIKNRNIADSIHACLIRFNPSDMDTYLRISSKESILDKGFSAISMNILNDTFKHCYHSGMDALLPFRGDYALNFFSKRYGDLLATFAEKKMLFFNFTDGKEM